jgi:SPP1 gp7 family putative phage head morphogenesis protein
MNRRIYLRLWLLALDKYEIMLRGKIARSRSAFIKDSAKSYEVNDGKVPNFVLEQHKRRISNILANHYRAIIPHFGAMVLKQVKSRRIDQKAANSLFNATMQEWLSTEALKKAAMISSTDMEDVRRAIAEGLADGEGIAAIAKNIRQVSSLTPYRAATVARTETHNAATFGSVETARAAEQELGIVLVKEWIATNDNRTRDAHKAADGQTTDLNGRFMVDGESLDRPGDPQGNPENIINCRCAVAMQEKA